MFHLSLLFLKTIMQVGFDHNFVKDFKRLQFEDNFAKFIFYFNFGLITLTSARYIALNLLFSFIYQNSKYGQIVFM